MTTENKPVHGEQGKKPTDSEKPSDKGAHTEKQGGAQAPGAKPAESRQK